MSIPVIVALANAARKLPAAVWLRQVAVPLALVLGVGVGATGYDSHSDFSRRLF